MARVSQPLLVVFLASSRQEEDGVDRSLANNFSSFIAGSIRGQDSSDRTGLNVT